MKSFALFGSVLPLVLSVMGSSDSIRSLEGRGLTDLEPERASELIKRSTSPPNVIVCNTAVAGTMYSDMRDINKVVTYAVQEHVPCAYFRSVLFIVYDWSTGDIQPAAFQYSSAKDVKNQVGSWINDGCDVAHPVKRNNKEIPPSPDDGLAFNTGWLNPFIEDLHVQTCPDDVLQTTLENLRALGPPTR
ncbi:uncharacterized protein MELLADRAFT_74478 [Melampsora larici-populina 98AG31]|uniref:Secreted protein n=1 Tax=Melampsora larici-populina (strain 98AG31 / pathotype 3-4-7) TaxID=747676 RepID=F4RFT9_MELLP|nr:uncharacterized protein MELLADRAFT_74478 [Melampsora larici-populina 98AG31]EGG08866.1 secreted protein [Melampsora larici-populina 98AG31]